MKRELQEFVQLSRRIGEDPFQTQAAGGNLSIKLTDKLMMIKASGARLPDVRKTLGWTLLDFKRLQQGMHRIRRTRLVSRREILYAEEVRKSSLSSARPSMEAGFHVALKDRYVFHIHSVAGLILSLLGPRRSKPLLDAYRQTHSLEFRWIPSRLPGMELSWDIYAQGRHRKPTKDSTLWLLSHHGVIWSGEDSAVMLESIASFESWFQKEWNFAHYPPPHRMGSRICQIKKPMAIPDHPKGSSIHLCMCRWPHVAFDRRPLFPDLIIYFDLLSKSSDFLKTSPTSALLSGRDRVNLSDKVEVFYSHAVTSSVLSALGIPVRPLAKALIGRIKNLETERARMKLIAQSSGRGSLQ